MQARLLWTLGAGLVASSAWAWTQQERQHDERSPVQRRTENESPPHPGAGPGGSSTAAAFPLEFRSIDGRNNNTQHPEWGAADTEFLRRVAAAYGDGQGSPAGADRPGPREVSNLVVAQEAFLPSSGFASDFVWQWGQFVDHDFTETPIGDPAEPFDIPVPLGDPWFDPFSTGAEVIPLDRSAYRTGSHHGGSHGGQRQQLNLITAFIDASNVYGSEELRANELRTLDGTGRLKTSPGDLLPFNTAGLHNAPSDAPNFFLGGDIRANEQVALTAMHTLFVREHNQWAERLGRLDDLDGEGIYQIARALVAAEMQAITYREFLPVLLGPGALPPYGGYDEEVDPSIANVFATAAYRFGHTMLSPQLLRLEADGSPHPAGPLPLAQAFFQPRQILAIGIDPYLRGLATQRAQEIDPYIVDDLRNLLFGPPGAGGLDLASLNIQRGRDHGLPSYNKVRQAYGLPPVASLTGVSSNPEIVARLEAAYSGIEQLDPWVGLLAEDHAPGALVGTTLRRVLRDQFRRLRDGDRFWYEAYLPQELVAFVEAQTLATIVRRNTDIGGELPENVFRVQ